MQLQTAIANAKSAILAMNIRYEEIADRVSSEHDLDIRVPCGPDGLAVKVTTKPNNEPEIQPVEDTVDEVDNDFDFELHVASGPSNIEVNQPDVVKEQPDVTITRYDTPSEMFNELFNSLMMSDRVQEYNSNWGMPRKGYNGLLTGKSEQGVFCSTNITGQRLIVSIEIDSRNKRSVVIVYEHAFNIERSRLVDGRRQIDVLTTSSEVFEAVNTK